MKAAALKRDMSEFKNSMSEINDLALGRNNTPALTGSTGTLSHQPPSINDLSNLNALNSSDAINKLKKKIRSSLENIVDGNSEPNITFPDDHEHDDDHMNLNMDLVKASNQLSTNGLNGSNVDTVKFEEKRTKTESKTKVMADGFSSEQATSNLAESKRLQTGDIDYQQAKAAAASRNRMEVDGVKTEENAAVIHVHREERGSSQNPLRQRDELRRRQSGTARGQRRHAAEGRIVRRQQRDGVRLYTSQGAALRRVVGSSGEVGEVFDDENRWQRAIDSRRASHNTGGNRGRSQLSPNLPQQQRSQRRRSPNPSSSTGRREPSSAAQRITNRRVAQAVVLEEMATYFRTQADVLAVLGERLRPEPANADTVVRGNARRRRRQNRRRARRQPPPNAVADGPGGSRFSRPRRQNQSSGSEN